MFMLRYLCYLGIIATPAIADAVYAASFAATPFSPRLSRHFRVDATHYADTLFVAAAAGGARMMHARHDFLQRLFYCYIIRHAMFRHATIYAASCCHIRQQRHADTRVTAAIRHTR